MATTMNIGTEQWSSGGLTFHHLDLSAGVADTTVTFTFVNKPVLKMVSVPWNVTTNSIAVGTSTYVLSTGVLTVSCANSDRVTVCVAY